MFKWFLVEVARRLGVTPAAISQRLAKPKRVLRDHGGFRSPSAAYSRLREDLERMEPRRRRIHDRSRTMITLALNDGARRDVLQGITHGNKGDIIDLYNSPLWSAVAWSAAGLAIIAGVARERSPVTRAA